jgi:hypothetical protein
LASRARDKPHPSIERDLTAGLPLIAGSVSQSAGVDDEVNAGDARRLAPAGERLWLICNAYPRSYLVMHDEVVAFHQLDPSTPFLIVNKRLRCVSCGEKLGKCG